MLLAIDIGNSNIVFGIFSENKLAHVWRIETYKNAAEKFYKKKVKELLKRQSITGVIIGSVVPELNKSFVDICSFLWNIKPLIVTPKLYTDIRNPKAISHRGADRIANIVGANTLYHGNTIVIDLGTATKFDVVSQKKEYLGGAIGPGIGTSYKALIGAASMLSKAKLKAPKSILGNSATQAHINSGFVLGFVSLVEGMVEKIIKEAGFKKPNVVGTGGFIELIAPQAKSLTKTNKDLTLHGLRILWEKNN